jgi:serine protease Do
MTAATTALSRRLRPVLAAICLGAAGALVSAPAFARGPDGIADVAEKVIDAVVNISTSQTIEAKGGDGHGTMPQLPPGSPFEEFFDDFFKNRRGGKGGGDLMPRSDPASSSIPRASSSPTTTSSPMPTRST